MGSFVGILGGPIGVLLGASVGVLTGSTLDAGDALLNMTLLEKVAERLEEGQPAVLALEQSAEADAAQKMFAKFDVTIFEEDAAVVMEEIEDAKKTEIELKREAHAKMRESKKAERKQKIEQNRAKIAADFDSLKAKFKKK